MHKIVVETHPQKTRNNGLVDLVLNLHHLSNQLQSLLGYKGYYKNKAELKYVSESRKFS